MKRVAVHGPQRQRQVKKPGVPKAKGICINLWLRPPKERENLAMDSFATLLPAAIGLLAGIGGYSITTFWMKPLLLYMERRSRILSDLIFYANVINTEGMNKELQDRQVARGVAFRRHSADLQASAMELPFWYWKKKNIRTACRLLMGLSNTTDYEHAQQRTSKIMLLLGFKGEVTETI